MDKWQVTQRFNVVRGTDREHRLTPGCRCRNRLPRHGVHRPIPLFSTIASGRRGGSPYRPATLYLQFCFDLIEKRDGRQGEARDERRVIG